MNKVLLVVVLCPVIAVCLPSSVAASTEIYEGDTNSMNFTMNDYHVTIKAEGPINNVSGVLSDDGTFHTPSISGEGTNEVSINFSGLEVPPGDSIGFCVAFTPPGGSYSIQKGLTAVGGYFEVPALGASVTPGGQYSLNNDHEQSINYSNLQWTVQATEFSGTDQEKAQLFENVAAGTPFDPGWDVLPGGTVGPLSDSGSLVDFESGPGEFLLTFFVSEFESGEGGQSPTLQVFEVPRRVPTNRTGALILVGLLVAAVVVALVILARRRR